MKPTQEERLAFLIDAARQAMKAMYNMGGMAEEMAYLRRAIIYARYGVKPTREDKRS